MEATPPDVVLWGGATPMMNDELSGTPQNRSVFLNPGISRNLGMSGDSGKPRSIAGRAELARYTLTRAWITGGNAALTPGCVLVALSGLK